MLNFTVGPVQASEYICEIGAKQIPYFRTPEFSSVMKENEELMIEMAGAPVGSRVVFLTCSSSGAMEAAVINCFSGRDKVLIINGGTFGQRFVDICKVHGIPYEELRLEQGRILRREQLWRYEGKEFTGLCVNINETSTGVLFDSEMIGEFCKENNLFYVCDCTSSFLTEKIDMEVCGVDVMITGSQKALACPPGISILVLDETAKKRIEEKSSKTLYFDLSIALKDGERGQTPFTPAVGILLQINARLREIKARGISKEIENVAMLASDFRERISMLPLTIFAENPANAVTSLKISRGDAREVVARLKDDYEIWVCPNGGELAQFVFRVGHIGCLTISDNERLVEALNELFIKGVFG